MVLHQWIEAVVVVNAWIRRHDNGFPRDERLTLD